MPSFDAVNYVLRPNKAVERKIVFSGLGRVSRIVNLSSYRYLGLGSLWFVDFLMAHKILGVDSMVSIEQSEIGHRRSEFNRPLACIEVIRGETTLVIPTLNLEQSPSIVWFDYDSSIDGPALKDIGMLAPRCARNSILIVTINAKRDQLPDKDENGATIETERSLRMIAGDLVPTPLDAKRLRPLEYPKLLCEILSNRFQSATTNSGRADSFVKLFDLAYNDGTPMVTVGGIVAGNDEAEMIQKVVESPEWEGIVQETISVPPLTLKEKMALDRLMPAAEPPTDAQMNKIGFHLKRAQIDTYHRYYRHYPVFGELIW